MLAATQPLVPAEVKSRQDESLAIADTARAVWPEDLTEYSSEDVRKVAAAMNRSISHLINSLVQAAADPLVKERPQLVSQAAEGIAELQRFQRALAAPVAKSRKAETVDIPGFRSAIPGMMDRTVRIWASMNPTHDVFLGWINGNQAEAIAQGFQDIVDVVKEMPGAREEPGFLSRHRSKIAAGVAVVGVGSLATWWFMRTQRAAHFQDYDPADLPLPPVGVHVFAPEPGDLSIMDRTITTPAGDQILITGDIDDRTSVGRVAEILRSLPDE